MVFTVLQQPASPFGKIATRANTLFSKSEIAYSDMASGEWTIIIQGEDLDISFQRKFQLNPTAPEKTVVTVYHPPLSPFTSLLSSSRF